MPRLTSAWISSRLLKSKADLLKSQQDDPAGEGLFVRAAVMADHMA